MSKTKMKWYALGIGLRVLSKLGKRYGQGWEDGVYHKGGICDGVWIVMGNRIGIRLRNILNLYETESEFLND